MRKKNAAKLRGAVKTAPMDVSGRKQDYAERVRVDYDAIARALADNDLNSQEHSNHVTGVHLQGYTILIQRLVGNKYRGLGTFGWTIWVKPKQRTS